MKQKLECSGEYDLVLYKLVSTSAKKKKNSSSWWSVNRITTQAAWYPDCSFLTDGGCAGEAGLLELEIIKLLFTIHLDHQWHDQDEKCGSSKLGSLPSGLQEFLGYECGVARSLPAPGHDPRLGEPWDDAQWSATTGVWVMPLGRGDYASSGLGGHESHLHRLAKQDD